MSKKTAPDLEMNFVSVAEAQPGPVWTELFSQHWPAYRRWWSREGVEARPTYLACQRALKKYMPELLPLYESLCECAGGGDEEARFLSFYNPPPYLSGCSQAIWPGKEPMLVRNYDYSPTAFDGTVFHSHWLGRTVAGTSDGLWGLLDGINDAGLAVSLTFGGRRVVGEGFGVPLILRYVLQTCDTAKQAGHALARIPTHMSYNITAVDAAGQHMTAYLAPDRPAVISKAVVATNHQEQVEWAQHARLTATVERERYLLQRITLHVEPQENFINAFLKPPLYSTAFSAGFGTIYTAVYWPQRRQFALYWPGVCWRFDLESFHQGQRRIRYPKVA